MTVDPGLTNVLPLRNFMLQDTLGSLLAVAAFATVLYAPGYIVAYAANLFGFRAMAFAERSIWAIACSFATAPIASYFLGRAIGLRGICCVLAGCGVVTLFLLWRDRTKLHWSSRDRKVTTLVALGWIAFVLLMLVDLQIGRKMYFSVVMADQSYRIAFTDAVVRTGVPPANPLYFPGSSAPMHYYYFWYVLCAAVVKIAHVSSRQAFIASSIWAGFGLLTTVKLYASHFFRWDRRQRWIAQALLVVTGADLLPALGNAILQPSLNGDIEWWSVDPVDAWPDSLLWVPHHTASVLCCLLAFLFVWRTLESLSRNAKRNAMVMAAIAFASAFGLSVYVAFGFALLMVAWLIRMAIVYHPERFRMWSRWTVVSVLSVALMMPFMLELVRTLSHAGGTMAGNGAGESPHVFTLSIRRMIDSGLLAGLPFFDSWNKAHPVLLDQTLRLLLLVPGLAMELGLYGAVLVLLLKTKRPKLALHPDTVRDTSLFFAVSGLLMSLFLSSSVITNNDFGYRAVMLPQFFLLLLAADVLGSWRSSKNPIVACTPGRRKLLFSLVAMGIAGSIYGAFLLRAWLPLEAHKVRTGFSQSPEEEFQIREAFDTLDRVASKNAVVSFRPIDPEPDKQDAVMTPNEYYQRMLVMNTGRQILNAEGKCAVHFGGDPSECAAIQSETARLYASPVPDAQSARRYCDRFGVEYLVVSSRDPNGISDMGWPATLPVVTDEPMIRVLQCADDKTRN